MNSFLICPVRGHTAAEAQDVVDKLEKDGWKVHFPHRDTNQNDPNGITICEENARAIFHADVVHVIWDGKSQGCLFDLGMAFALGKKIIPLELPPLTEGKSFQNMITEWGKY